MLFHLHVESEKNEQQLQKKKTATQKQTHRSREQSVVGYQKGGELGMNKLGQEV